MIETGEFTMAESKEEAMWIETRDRYQRSLEAIKKDIVFIEAVIELCNSKIKKHDEN